MLCINDDYILKSTYVFLKIFIKYLEFLCFLWDWYVFNNYHVLYRVSHIGYSTQYSVNIWRMLVKMLIECTRYSSRRSMITTVYVEFTVPRRCNSQRNGNNVPADTPKRVLPTFYFCASSWSFVYRNEHMLYCSPW